MDSEDPPRGSREWNRMRRGSRGGAGPSGYSDLYTGPGDQGCKARPDPSVRPKSEPGRIVRRKRGRWVSECIYCEHSHCESCPCCSLWRQP